VLGRGLANWDRVDSVYPPASLSVEVDGIGMLRGSLDVCYADDDVHQQHVAWKCERHCHLGDGGKYLLARC